MTGAEIVDLLEQTNRQSRDDNVISGHGTSRSPWDINNGGLMIAGP